MSSQTGYPGIQVSPKAINVAPWLAALRISSRAFTRLAVLLWYTGAAWAIATRTIELEFTVTYSPGVTFGCAAVAGRQPNSGCRRSWITSAFQNRNHTLTNDRPAVSSVSEILRPQPCWRANSLIRSQSVTFERDMLLNGQRDLSQEVASASFH
jgi:hypothetical protein